MAIAEDTNVIFFSFQLCLLQTCPCNKLNALKFYHNMYYMSYDANASMCNLKLNYPFYNPVCCTM